MLRWIAFAIGNYTPLESPPNPIYLHFVDKLVTAIVWGTNLCNTFSRSKVIRFEETRTLNLCAKKQMPPEIS